MCKIGIIYADIKRKKAEVSGRIQIQLILKKKARRIKKINKLVIKKIKCLLQKDIKVPETEIRRFISGHLYNKKHDRHTDMTLTDTNQPLKRGFDIPMLT